MPSGVPVAAPPVGRLVEPPVAQAGPALAAFGITEPDLWWHATITPAQLGSVGAPLPVAPPGDFSRVLIAVIDAVSVFAKLNAPPTQAPNGYDLVNPGGALLNFPVPRSKNLVLVAATGLAFNVDLWLFGGSFSYRAQ